MDDFDRVRAAFSVSLPSRLLSGTKDAIESGWRGSFFGGRWRGLAGAAGKAPAATIRIAATAVAIAAAMQPLLMQMMPATVRPALPAAVFFAVALLAAGVAIKSREVAQAWPTSRISRWLR